MSDTFCAGRNPQAEFPSGNNFAVWSELGAIAFLVENEMGLEGRC